MAAQMCADQAGRYDPALEAVRFLRAMSAFLAATC
jgi:hypothetical protein